MLAGLSGKVKKEAKSQAALEFLMTYGWVIMVVLVSIGALAYFGVLGPDKFVPRRCALEPGIGCRDFKVQEDAVTLVLMNGKGEDVTITSIKVGSCTGTTTGSLKNGEEATFRVGGCNNAVSEKFNEEVNITYTSESGLIHKKRGNVADKVESGNAFTTSTLQLNPTDDSYLYQFTPSTNYGTDTQIQIYPRTPSWTKRGIIKFDFSSLPSDATINSAVLYLHEATTYGLTRTIGAYRATIDWSENAVTWNSIGNNFEATSSATATLTWDGILGWDTWNVATDVQDFFSGAKANYGWLLMDASEDSSEQYWYLNSKEAASNRPYLEVSYTSAMG